MKSKFAVLFIPMSLLAVGFFARHTAQRAWNAFVHYETPYVFSNPGAASTSPMVEHVYIVLVDGLRYDKSRHMHFLNELRSRGTDIACTVGVPSLSLPGRAAMMTGAWQDLNGQLTNFNAHRIPVETLFHGAKKKGLTTALAAGKNVQKMFAPDVDETITLPSMEGHALSWDMAKYESDLHQVGSATREVVRTKHPNLFLMDYTMTDGVAHDFGAASEQYARAVEVTDGELRDLAAIIDFSNSVLMVTADHGHLDRGGHGGDEPEVLSIPTVMAGKGIRTNGALLGRQIDLAPTVSALLGTEIPADNQGRLLTEAFEVEDSVKMMLLENLFQQKKNFTNRYLSSVRGVASLASTELPAAKTVASLEAAIDQFDAEAQTARQERMALEPAARLKWVLTFILLPMAGMVVFLQQRWISPRDLRWGFLVVGIYWVVYFLLFLASHMAYSFSAVNVEENLERYFGKNMIFAVVAFVAGIALTTGLLRRQLLPSSMNPGGGNPSSGASWARFSYVASAMITFSILVKVCYAYWQYGLFVRWYVPNMHWGFGLYLDLLQLTIVGFVSVLAPVAAWLGIKMIRRPKEAVKFPA